MKITKYAFVAALLFGVCAIKSATAEITSQNCPYNCGTAGVNDKEKCREWQEAGKCYVEIKDGAERQTYFGTPPETETIVVNQLIQSGDSIGVEVPAKFYLQVSKLEIKARKEGASTRTQLGVSVDDLNDLGAQPLSKAGEQILLFTLRSNLNDKDITLNAVEGDVYVSSVTVYGK